MARSPKSTQSSPRSNRRLRVEGLEPRAMMAVTPVAPIDLGPIEYLQRADVDPSGADVWFEMESTMAGFLSVSADQPASGTVDFTLYDAAGEQLAASRDFLGTERLDYDAPNLGETYYLRVQGTATDVDLSLANRVRLSETPYTQVVTVYGTDADDTFSYRPEDVRQGVSGNWVSIEDIQYRFTRLTTTTTTSVLVTPFQVSFNGRGGYDTIVVAGTLDSEAAELWPGYGTVTGTYYSVNLTNTEGILLDGSGGTDTAVLYDAPTDDYFTAFANESTVLAAGCVNTVADYESVAAIARYGGTDTARFHGTAGADQFIGRSEMSRLNGYGYAYAAKYFDFVHAYGHGNAADAAVFYDTDGDDTFVAASDYAKMYGTGYFNRAMEFANVYGRSTGDGYDVAILHDTVNSDTLSASGLNASLASTTNRYEVTSFSLVTAISSHGGYDAKRIGLTYFDLLTIGPWHNA